jgi:hypothetical protein
MAEWLCWNEYGNGHTEDDGEIFDADTAADAAKAYVEKHFYRWEYPTNSEINVRSTSSSIVRVVDVTVEPIPYFHATERKGADHGK